LYHHFFLSGCCYLLHLGRGMCSFASTNKSSVYLGVYPFIKDHAMFIASQSTQTLWVWPVFCKTHIKSINELNISVTFLDCTVNQ
jgi:hypothetical protein